MGVRLKIQLLLVAAIAWVASGVADRHALPFVMVVSAVVALICGLLSLVPEGDP